jgi:hypothetical protein
MFAVIASICLVGSVLCIRSIVVLGRSAPWTSAGWLLTIGYFALVAIKLTVDPRIAATVEYVLLALMAVAFIVAGVRDEPQAEPWWWPNRRGATRSERRAAS